jgi:hypothetical protein
MMGHEGNDMRFAQFHHKGLRQLHEGNPKGVPPTMADKLRKLLFALEMLTTLSRSVGFRVGSFTRSEAT